MKAYRGLFTDRYTYVRNTDGPWLLYDRKADPYQMHNLASDPAHAPVRARLEAELQQRLDRQGDEFLDGRRYLERDRLTHYGEVKYKASQPWVDPWLAK
jgi:arylsulfatase A-like enzyme